MTRSQIDPPALLLAVIAVGLAVALLPGSFGWLSTAAGITLLLILFAYDQQGRRSGFQSLAFSAVCGFSFMLAVAYALQRFTGRSGLDELLALTWAVATIVGVFVDRTRVSGRPDPVHERPVGSGDRITAEAPLTPTVQTTAQPSTAAPPSTTSPITAPPTSAAYAPPEATIYVALVGEGISCLRSVRAEHLSRDIYRIVDEMPEEKCGNTSRAKSCAARSRLSRAGKFSSLMKK